MIAVGATANIDGGIGIGDDSSWIVGRSMGTGCWLRTCGIGVLNTVVGSGELNVTSFKIDDLICSARSGRASIRTCWNMVIMSFRVNGVSSTNSLSSDRSIPAGVRSILTAKLRSSISN